MSRTPQSKPPQRTATRALGFRAGNVVAGELMTFIYGAVYKGISRWQERFGLSPATSPTANERIQRQDVTQRSKKNGHDHQRVCRDGRRCARLALQSAASPGV